MAMVAAAMVACIAPTLVAQGTRQWTVDRYEDLQRGTADGVAIRNDGRLEAGMSATVLYTAVDSYVWSLAEASNGAVFAGLGGDKGGSAAVVRLGPDGAEEKIFSGKELAVQAIKTAPDGSILMATSPDGKVYQLHSDGSGQHVLFDPASTAEKPRYIWDMAVSDDGTVYVATGLPAAVYRVGTKNAGKPELLFRTTDGHIRSLLLGRNGILWAGSDGAGIVYRLNTRQPGAEPFAAYASGHREITAMVIGQDGSLYAAAVGAKGPSSLPPLAVTGAVGVTVTFLQPGSGSAASANGVVTDGSEIDRIAPDGTPERLVTLKDDVVYALMLQGSQVLAATGNRGRIYAIDPTVPGRLTDVARIEAAQATAMAVGPAGMLIGSSNGGKVLRLQSPSVKAQYTSEVFDAGQFAKWGRVAVEARAASFDLSARVGNVPSTTQGWSAWMPMARGADSPALPGGRYAQWRADLHADGSIDSVTMNYLPRNVAPVVDDVVVATGARVVVNAIQPQAPSVQIVFPGANLGQTINVVQPDSGSAPLTAQKDRTGIVVRWSAHDDNGDDLVFSVWYRGLGETTWRLLKDKISDRFLSLDASLLPDGRYEVKVLAKDAPQHTEADTLAGDRLSAPFTVDTTPPIAGPLTARMDGNSIAWSLDVRDSTSPIAHAEISIDGEDWQYVEPVGGLSDSLQERYATRSALHQKNGAEVTSAANAVEHVLAVRVYDRAENMVSVKTTVR